MPYDFYIPAEPADWTRATLLDSGELIIHDYDVEVDEAAAALGFNPSLVLQVISAWEEEPIALLCGDLALLPIDDSGVAATAWAKLAVDTRAEHPDLADDPDRLELLYHAISLAQKVFEKRTVKYRYKKVLQARRDLGQLIADSTSYYMGRTSTPRTGYAMKAVMQVLDGIAKIGMLEAHGGAEALPEFCRAAAAASIAIEPGTHRIAQQDIGEQQWRRVPLATDELIEVAIPEMGRVQRARRRAR